MENNLAQRRRTLEEKIPDIKKSLGMVEFLHERHVSMCRPSFHFFTNDNIGGQR